MAGAEVEHIARAALVGHARPEHLAALEPADEHGFQGFRDAKGLAIHFFIFDFEMIRQTGGDRMVAAGDPETLALAGLAPGQVAGRAHQPLERLGEVGRVQEDHAHAAMHRLSDTLDDLVVNLAMDLVAPPDQHIGLGQLLYASCHARGLAG